MDNVRTMIFKVIFMITMILNNSRQSNELGFYHNADTNKGTSNNYTFSTIVIADMIRNPLIKRGC